MTARHDRVVRIWEHEISLPSWNRLRRIVDVPGETHMAKDQNEFQDRELRVVDFVALCALGSALTCFNADFRHYPRLQSAGQICITALQR
jgi:hypothetical protein